MYKLTHFINDPVHLIQFNSSENLYNKNTVHCSLPTYTYIYISFTMFILIYD